MISSWPVSLAFLATTAIGVAATGTFPPITGPPGLCGPDPSDLSCAVVLEHCVTTVADRNNPFGTESCVAAAACYPGNPDTFLSNFYCRFYNFSGSKSAGLPRVPNSIVNNVLGGGQSITYQSFSKWYTNLVTSIDSSATALIDPVFVKTTFDIILAWTGFCSTGQIPPSNFVDWFQWFSTVSGPATTCGLVNGCTTTNYPYVMDLTVTCAKNQNAISDPFSIPSCVAAALNWVDGIDSFLSALTCQYNINFNTNQGVPASNNLPAFTFDWPVANSPPYTQQNFIDFTYGSLSAIGSGDVRYPQIIDWVTLRWTIITSWTSFCSTQGIAVPVPESNMSDFLKYSHFPLTSTSCLPGGCGADPHASCDQLLAVCLKSSTILTDPYQDINCVLASTCWGGGPKSFGNSISCAKNTFGRHTDPDYWPRLTQATFNTISQTGVASQQNYIDAYYGALAKLPSPLWPNVNYVIANWAAIATWTGFPSGDVPYSKLADWLQLT